ncbi:MAG TPA: PAS domain-containing protein [Stellaceae bacterium]|nr:PAS domain-containing protein [Stellaceae bacterium]
MPDSKNAKPRHTLARTNEAGARADPTLTLDEPALKALLAVWEARRKGRRMPARADFDPLDLKAHLGHLFLVDVEREPRRYRVRLVGTRITTVVQRDVTGMYLDAIYAGTLLESLAQALSWVVDERAPLRVYSRAGHPQNPVYFYEGLLLPLSADGESVNMVLGGLHFTPDIALTRAQAGAIGASLRAR